VDLTGKIPGRGSYLHDRPSCWERGLKGALAHALKVELTDQDREVLHTFMASLPPEETQPALENSQESGTPQEPHAGPVGKHTKHQEIKAS
jgi:hypothetical protein